MPPISIIASPLRRILLSGAAAALVAAAAGFGIEVLRLGTRESAALARVERDVRRTIDETARDLQALAADVAPSSDDMAATSADAARLRPLFDRVDDALTKREAGTFGVTIYDAAGAPLVWGGRPSDVTPDRIAGPATLFVAPGPLGPRLVQLHPILDAAARRVGTVAAERVFVTDPGVRRPAAENFVLDTSLVVVELRALYEGAGEARTAGRFPIAAPTGEPLLEGEAAPHELARARRDWRRMVGAAVVLIAAITLLLTTGPVLSWRNLAATRGTYAAATLTLVAILLAARAVLRAATWIAPPVGPLLSPDAYASSLLAPLFGNPAEFLFDALLTAALTAVAADAIERGRRARRHVFVARPLFLAAQLVAGALVAAAAMFAYQPFLRDTLAHSHVDILHFSLHPWSIARLAINGGLLLFNAASVGAGVLILRGASTWWHARPHVPRIGVAAAWAAGAAGVLIVAPGPAIVIAGACMLFAALTGRVVGQYRNASQAARLIILFLALFVPSLVTYPALTRLADAAKRRLIETQLAAQVASQRQELLAHLRRTLDQIDRIRELPDLVDAAATQPGAAVSTDTAFLVWSQTDLATHRLMSAVELYAGNGALVGRFALSLPEYTSTPQQWTESSCRWDVFGENLPFGSDERPLLHAGRRLCASESDSPVDADRAGAGSIVVHVALDDYTTLPFISSQSAYFELFRPRPPIEGESAPERDVEFVVYGWGRMPAYTSTGAAWPLDEPVFSRIYASRQPFWTPMARDDRIDEVYFLNDRSAIYALGYPRITLVGHLVNLAEVAALAGLVFVTLVVGGSVFTAIAQRRPTSGRQFLREIRASFYRKLFLAFVLASIVPVIALAFLTRTYIAAQLRAGIYSAAVRTAAVARRVIEEYTTLQQRGAGAQPALDDDLMVEISRVIDQDVNIFTGPRLTATSERDLFASGLLPTRTPGDVYRAIALERRPSFVGLEQAGATAYMLAAAPVRAGDRDAILTVPLTLQRLETEREIDELDRRVLLAAMIFILVGAGIGYSMAERIADPVNRLTRATRRIARGDLDARIATTSADELRRLVDDFNSMAAELKRQREQLERTHRLEAWAQMARQVAHDIKNPLTPIQLSAEHLQRVHTDRGQPLTPVLQDCVTTILSQVRLLRQISAEFSSFASSPNPRPEPTAVGDVVHEVVDPYATPLAGRIRIAIDIPSSTPLVSVDRTLLARALTNVIENALYAMPGPGVMTIRATVNGTAGRVALTITDTGVGMDREGLARIFEPYFSTKATGTGLGLTIAKRNIEANSGTIAVTSEKGVGTTVTIELPVAN